MRFETKKLIIFLFLVLIRFESTAQTYFPPLVGKQWDTTSTTKLNWCNDSIPSLLKYVGDNKSKAFLVLVDGKIVIEKYYGTFTQDSIWYWASAGKSLLATTVGIASQENLIDIQKPSSYYLDTAWTSCSLSDELNIKIVNQLSMTSGINDNVVDVDCTLPSCLTCIAPARNRWAYYNAIYTLLEDVVSNATNQTLNAYLNSKIKAKTGMTGLYVKQGYNNVYFSNARSMARFGLLAMNNFVWNGDTVLKDGAYKTQMTNTSQNLNLSYGYLWWLNGKSSFMLPSSQLVFNSSLLPDAPSDLFSALGKNGQIINVVPSKKIVLVRIGDRPTNANELPMIFNNEIWKRLNYVICNSSNGISESKFQPKIYPNPSKDFIIIDYPETLTNISIYNALGQAQPVTFDNNKVDVSTLPAGVYTIVISNGKSIFKNKLLTGSR